MSMQKGSTQAHQNLLKNFEMQISKEFPDLFVLGIVNGMFRAFDDVDRIVRSGKKGVLDIIVFGNQKYLFFDGKTGKSTFSKFQKFFKQRMIEVNKGTDVAFKLPDLSTGMELVRKHFAD